MQIDPTTIAEAINEVSPKPRKAKKEGNADVVTINNTPRLTVAQEVANAMQAKLVHDGGSHCTIERAGLTISVNTAKGADIAIKNLRRCGW